MFVEGEGGVIGFECQWVMKNVLIFIIMSWLWVGEFGLGQFYWLFDELVVQVVLDDQQVFVKEVFWIVNVVFDLSDQLGVVVVGFQFYGDYGFEQVGKLKSLVVYGFQCGVVDYQCVYGGKGFVVGMVWFEFYEFVVQMLLQYLY